jgi:RecB family exonuclease
MSHSPPLHRGTYLDLADALARLVIGGRRERGETSLAQWLANPVEIIVPSRGVMERVEESLLRENRGAVAGVHLRTPDSFARAVCERNRKLRRIAPELLQNFAMESAVVRRAPAELRSPGLAAMMRRSYRDLRDTGLRIEDAAPRIQTSRVPVPPIRIWREYESLIAKAAAVDPADVFLEAIDLLEATTIPPQIVFGFYDATRLQERLFERLAETGRLHSLWIPSHAENASGFAERFIATFERFGGEIVSSGPRPRAAVEFLSFSTPRAEAREVCRRIRALVDSGVDPKNIAIVVRSIDEIEATLFDRGAEEFGFAIDRGRERPLASTRIGRAILLLESLGEHRFPRAEVIELLRTRIRIARLSDRPEWIDKVSRKLRIGGGDSQYVAEATKHLEMRDRERTAIDGYLEALRAIEGILESWPRRQDGDSWADTIETTTALFFPIDQVDVHALARFDELADTLRQLRGEIDRSTIIERIRTMSIESELPAARFTIRFSDVMQLRGASFEHLFLTRMQSERFPQRRTDDLILNAKLREALAIRQIGDGADEERFLFEMVLDAASTKLHASFARHDTNGKEDFASSLLKSLAASFHPEEATHIYGDFGEWVRRQMPAAPAVRSRSEEMAETVRREPIHGSDRMHRALAMEGSGKAARFDGGIETSSDLIRTEVQEKLERGLSPTSLEMLVACPHRFFLQAILDLKDLDDPDLNVDIEIRQRGTADHEVLEKLFAESDARFLAQVFNGDEAARAKFVAGIDAKVDEVYDRIDRESPPILPAARSMERENSRKQLRRFLDEEIDSLVESGWRPELFELSFGKSEHHQAQYEAAEVTIGNRSFRIRGKIDRIDRMEHDGSKVRIVDYKSGTASKFRSLKNRVARGEHVQLPLYALAVSNILGVDSDKITAEIKPLKPGTSGTFNFEFADVRNEFEQGFVKSLDVLDEAKHFAAIVTDSCEYCVVSNWCREKHSNPFEDDDWR